MQPRKPLKDRSANHPIHHHVDVVKVVVRVRLSISRLEALHLGLADQQCRVEKVGKC